MSSISTYFKIGEEQADNIKKAAEFLVGISCREAPHGFPPEEHLN